MAADPIEFEIRPFEEGDRGDVKALWQSTAMFVESQNPDADIDRKLAHSPEWFFVGLRGNSLVATVMVGYDGHRGHINYLAVHGSEQGTGVGAAMALHAEQELINAGCDKVTLLIRDQNQTTTRFAETMGYELEPFVKMGKFLANSDLDNELAELDLFSAER